MPRPSKKPARFAGAIEASLNTVLLRSAVSEFLAFQRHKGSSASYVQLLEDFLGDRPKLKARWQPLLLWSEKHGIEALGQLDKPAVNAWLAFLQETTTPIQHGMGCDYLRRFLRWCVDEGYLKELPCRIVSPKQEKKEISVFTTEEIDRLDAVVKNENPRDYAIFMLLIDTGIRSSELIGIRTGDIRWDREEILIRGKGKRQRVVSFHGSLGAMSKYRRIRPDTDRTDAYFLSFAPGRAPVWSGGNPKAPKGRQKLDRFAFAAAPLTRPGLFQLVQKWGRLAGITEARCSPHTFRHYYAVEYLRTEGNLAALQQLLGHSNVDTTMIYAKLAQIDVMRAARTFSPALRLVSPRLRTTIDAA